MRIALVIRATSGRGGMETVYKTVIRELIAQGETVKMFILQGTADPHWLEGLPYEIIGVPGAGRLRRYYDFTVSYVRALKAFNPDTVIVSDPNIIMFTKIAAMFLKPRLPVGTWVHFPVSTLKKTALLKYADYHFAVSQGIARELEQAAGKDGGSVHVLYNSILTREPFIPRSAAATFLFIGRLDENSKRVSDFITALSRVRGEFKAIVIGDGDDYPKLIALSNQLQLQDRIEWRGWVYKPWEHVPPVSALVLTSAFEAFGMVLVEAMSRGIPCLSTDCDYGPAEIIQPDANGWLVPVGDINAIAGRLQQIVENPERLPDSHAVQSSVARFDTTGIIATMRGILRSEVEKKRRKNLISLWKVVIFDGEKNE
ncbi:glycosyltransferase [Paenibacillus piri]|nr:glycosyltransferase [Paenibacillus piri]